MSAKTKLMIRRTIWWLIVMLGIPISLCIINAVPTDLDVIDTNCNVEYSEYSDYSTCDIEIKFNAPVNNGYATVAFYDNHDQLLDRKECYFFS